MVNSLYLRVLLEFRFKGMCLSSYELPCWYYLMEKIAGSRATYRIKSMKYQIMHEIQNATDPASQC